MAKQSALKIVPSEPGERSQHIIQYGRMARTIEFDQFTQGDDLRDQAARMTGAARDLMALVSARNEEPCGLTGEPLSLIGIEALLCLAVALNAEGNESAGRKARTERDRA